MNLINKKHKRGITLIELVIVISLIGIIVQIVYLTYFISNKSFTISKNKGFAQQDVRIMAEYINKELRFIELLSLEPLSGTYYSLELIENDNGRKSLVKKKYDKDGGSESIIFGNINNLFLENSLPGIMTTNVTQKVDDQLYELEYNTDLVNNASLKTDITTSLYHNKLYYSFPKDKIITEEQENENEDYEN